MHSSIPQITHTTARLAINQNGGVAPHRGNTSHVCLAH